MDHLLHPWHYAEFALAFPGLSLMVWWLRTRFDKGKGYEWPWLPITLAVGLLLVGSEITSREWYEHEKYKKS